MRIFGLEISLASRAKMQAVDTRGGWFSLVREAFAGAWQGHVQVDAPKDILAFSGVFACVTKIAGDIAKMRPMLVADNPDGTCTEIAAESPYRAVLEKPNHYQNRIKFVQQWVISKLLHGNAYALKARDARGLVRKLFILEPTRVTPLVTDAGEVYYRLATDHLSGLKDTVVVPATEIIHDLMCPLWHPLVGVSPIYACGVSATMGNRIQRNSTTFFDNMSLPSGFLMSPGKLDPADAAELKRQWNENYGKGNLGGTAVLANGLTFKEGAMIPPQDAQLIEQLKWTVEDVARCYHMPAYKIGGAIPPNSSVESLNQAYYSECLQVQIEDIELALKEGLGMPRDYYVEFDLDALMRMDTTAMVLAEKEAVGAGIKSPDESRKRMNLPPVPGGASPYMQQQNYSLAALAKRDAKEDPFKADAPKPAPAPDAANDDEIEDVAEARALLADIVKECLPCE
jgi:HK97 family phage portal protein